MRLDIGVVLVAIGMAISVPGCDKGDSDGSAGLVAQEERQASVDRVSTLLSRLADYGYAGAVAVGGQDGVWFAEGFGLSDRERGLPFGDSTGIDIGSLTKVFTATLIMSVEEGGLLTVEDSLADHFDGVPPDKDGITIHQLLTHTSGLSRSAIRLGVDEATGRDGFLAAVLASDLLYPPGTRFEYSDTGYDLLAAIVEGVTGQPFADALKERVLLPGRLDQTGYASEAASNGGVADSYSAPLGSPWSEDREGPSPATWYNRGSGGLISTVFDLQALVRLLKSGDLLMADTVDRMLTVHVQLNDDLGYGYGWYVRGPASRGTAFHGGDIAGYKAHLELDLSTGRIVAALDNVLGWERVTDQYVVDAWNGVGPDLPPAAMDDSAPGPSLSGSYRFEGGETLLLWSEAGLVGAEARGQAAVDLLFGVTDDRLHRRTADAVAVMRALKEADAAFLTTRVRDRDRIAGLPQRLLDIWSRLEVVRGGVTGITVVGSYPAQDGTVVSFVDVERDSGIDPMRLIWRGDQLVGVGGSEGLRAPTVALTVVDEHRLARFEPTTGLTAEVIVADDRLTLMTMNRSMDARRDETSPISPPARSLARELVPIFMRDGAQAGIKRLLKLQESRAEDFEIDEGALNRLGYRLLRIGAQNQAIAVFRHAAGQYPESWNAFDSLGEAHLAAGNVAAARAAYGESLRLNSENQTARRVLEEAGGS